MPPPEAFPVQTVTVSRELSAPADAVREAVLDVEPFTRAAGFDDVVVDGRAIHGANDVGIAEIGLELEVVEDPDAVLAYEQREGIFERMRTAYTLGPTEDGIEIRARTEFALELPLVGEVLDATVVSRQRRRELEAQFDHLEAVAGEVNAE